MWYKPPASSMSAPLHRQHGPHPTKMDIGYGENGGFGFEFVVPEGEKVESDTGFLKLYVSTEQVDMDIITQPPLPNIRPRLGRIAKSPPFWTALCAAVTVTK